MSFLGLRMVAFYYTFLNFPSRILCNFKALEYARAVDGVYKSIETPSDSWATFHACTCNEKTSQMNSEIQATLVSLKNNKRLYWIKSHVGLSGKEYADFLSKDVATGSAYVTDGLFIPISSLVAEMQKFLQQDWNAEYVSRSYSRKTHLFSYHPHSLLCKTSICTSSRYANFIRLSGPK